MAPRPKTPAALAKEAQRRFIAEEKRVAKAAAKAETKARLEAERVAREAAKFEKKRPTCAECGGRKSVPVDGDVIYPHRMDLYELRFWLCPCGARCGVHKNSADLPKGRPGHKATRDARIAAHASFDPIWKAKSAATGLDLNECRKRAYRWLGGEMGLAPEDTHIGWMTEADCKRVIALCDAIREAARRRALGELL